MENLIFEKSQPGRKGYQLPALDVPSIDPASVLGKSSLRQHLAELPEMSELDTVRHYTRLSQLNFSIDTNFYPLGSCTMKYNPKVNDAIAMLPGFAGAHPLAPSSVTQGTLELLYNLEDWLVKMTGLDAFTLHP